MFLPRFLIRSFVAILAAISALIAAVSPPVFARSDDAQSHPMAATGASPVPVKVSVEVSAQVSEPVSGAAETPVRTDTYSGYPVPRFVAAKGRRTNCRQGPSLAHAIAFTFQRPGVPLLVVAESKDHWRKVRDAAGDECWVYHTTITKQSHVVVLDAVTLRASRSTDAAVRAHLAPGVFVRLEKTATDAAGARWLLLSTSEARGWAPADRRLWGADPSHSVLASSASSEPS
ncbi:MAG: SH3 domain-containing protein [Pseudomonadota bacterium]